MVVAHGVWKPPRPGIEPVPPALAGRFLTTGPTRGVPKKDILLVFPMKALQESCLIRPSVVWIEIWLRSHSLL